jgi:glucose/arabinose dehydrogenase
MSRRHVLVCAAGLVAVLAGCSSGTDRPSASTSSAPTTSDAAPSPAPSGSAASPTADTRVLTARVSGVVARGLAVPWGMAFLPDGTAVVSERDSGRIKRVTPGGSVTTLGTVRGIHHGGEGGLLGLAVSPSYATDHLLFAYFTAGDDNRIARITYDGSGLSGQVTIFRGIPAAGIHDGGRIAFGPDRFLYVGTGEAGRREPAQDRRDLGGKILRITMAGRPAPGNPFPGSPVYSLGHRNVQGLAWDTRGQLWASEFGQDEWDELNRIRPGGNYGWPVVEGKAGRAPYIDPIRQWPTDDASPSGIAVAGNAVYMAALHGARLWQIPIPGGTAGTPKALLSGTYGRLRTVTLAPDGSLWVSTSNRDGRGEPRSGDDKILRLTLS